MNKRVRLIADRIEALMYAECTSEHTVPYANSAPLAKSDGQLGTIVGRVDCAHPGPNKGWMADGPATMDGPARAQQFHKYALFQQIAENSAWPKFF